MYINDSWLMCWNQHCDTPIRFRTAACRINDDRQILAESQHNFHFLLHFNSKTTVPIFTKLLHDVVALLYSGAINACIRKIMVHAFLERESKE